MQLRVKIVFRPDNETQQLAPQRQHVITTVAYNMHTMTALLTSSHINYRRRTWWIPQHFVHDSVINAIAHRPCPRWSILFLFYFMRRVDFTRPRIVIPIIPVPVRTINRINYIRAHRPHTVYVRFADKKTTGFSVLFSKEFPESPTPPVCRWK